MFAHFLTRYSYAVSVCDTVVVCLSVICPSVTDVLWLSIGSQGKLVIRLISLFSMLSAYKIWGYSARETFSNVGLNGKGRKKCAF